jgi:hypothetical protein
LTTVKARSIIFTMSDVSSPFVQPRSATAYWICQLAGWGFYTAAKIYSGVSLFHFSVFASTRDLVLLHGLGLLGTHGLRAFATRHAWAAKSVRALIPRVLAAGIAIGVPIAGLSLLSPTAVLQNPDALGQVGANGAVSIANGEYGTTFLVQSANWSFLLVVWQALYFGALTLRARRWALLRQSELARALQLAELRALKSQLNPHFLFNALNTVRSLIAEDPKRAQEAVTRLAGTLRYALGASQAECVPLEREMATVEDYLMLESLRFEDRLRIERHIEPEALAMSVPVMLLQTLVENAIKHGIAARPGPGLVEIRAARRDNALSIEVANQRPVAAASPAGAGVGLTNARERLRLLFGHEASLDLDLSDPERAVARVRIPAVAQGGVA